MADSRTLSYTAEQIDAILAAAQRCSNRNLLDNWYFGNPVDQRGGYVVPPGTPYYSDTDLTTQAGTVSAYTKATNINGSYGTITVSGTTYYVAWSAAVRGYTGAGYGIDRWILIEPSTTIILNDDYIHLSYTKAGWNMAQTLEKILKNGNTYTFSILYKATGNNIRLVVSWGNEKYYYNIKSPITEEWNLATITGTIPNDAVIDYEQVVIQSLNNDAGTIDIMAAKLELGDHQTLAHQDANGNWVLNEPPPDKNMELLKCQRYYQLYSSADKRPVKTVDCRPTMRIDPVQGTIVIDGTTYYYNSAEL